MRYISVGGEVIPKHCIYGPRPAEGIVFNNYEWWSITDHLVKDQREREMAAVLRAKEEAKKQLSFNMTSNWSNTLASIKTQGNQKRIEKMEKMKQDRIDAYKEIMKNRKEEKKKILEDVKKILFEEKDAVKTVNSAVWLALVLDDRKKQIEFKNALKNEQDKVEAEWVNKMKKDSEDYQKKELEEKTKNNTKLDLQKKYLDEQMADLERRRVASINLERELQKQDLINMKIEGEKIHHCNMVEKCYKKKFAAKYMRKTETQIEHKRVLSLEEEEENEINKIFIEYNRRFAKERKEREERIKCEQVERRVRIAEILAQKLAETRLKEEESILSAIKQKEEQAQQEEELKKEKERQALADLLEGKRKAEEKRAKELYERKEEKKWEMMQQYRSAEINEEWREAEKNRKEEMKKQLREQYDQQCKEAAEKQEKDLKEWLAPLEDESVETEDLLKYFQETLDFAKENNLYELPIRKAIREMKQKYNIWTKEEFEEINRKQREAGGRNDYKKQKSKPMGSGWYCFKC